MSTKHPPLKQSGTPLSNMRIDGRSNCTNRWSSRHLPTCQLRQYAALTNRSKQYPRRIRVVTTLSLRQELPSPQEGPSTMRNLEVPHSKEERLAHAAELTANGASIVTWRGPPEPPG